MTDFKREDYIYLRYFVDDEENSRKKGDIVRYNKKYLLENLRGRRFGTCFRDEEGLEWIENPDADENEIMFDKVYKSINVTKDWRGSVYLWSEDYLYLDNWLFSHLDSYGVDLVKNLQSEVIPNRFNTEKFVELKEGCPNVDAVMKMYFKEGEKLDFSIPDVAALFYNPYFLDIFSKTEVIVGEEKEQLFNEDYNNAIYADEIEDTIYSLSNPKEQHYFKLNEDIKVKTDDELAELLGQLYISIDMNTIRNEEGYITHVCTLPETYGNSDRHLEQNVLKIANRVSAIEALEVYKKACVDYAKKRNDEHIAFMKKMEEKEKKLDALYQEKKDNPEIFPGMNGNFIHVNKSEVVTDKKHTLKQIQEFYQKLKNLNPNVVKHMCFYGGTIPYILNNASESREFGDIDIFMPTKHMEELRDEFAKQESFEIICDSKVYAEACKLTTRIAKEKSELALIEKQTSEETVIQDFANTLMNLMIPKADKADYIDENGIVHNPLNVHNEDRLSYYRKIQDFGFKAKLFGVNISVFPIYEYDNNIMAKSFNINEMYQFLLGVKVLNNTKLSDFVKSVNIYDSVFNIMPLEYTLASKQSAVEGNYTFRNEKDKNDIEYILANRDKLEISDEKLQEILKNYPDYSISIAYEVSGGQTTTISGETYKQLVLTNRHLS